MEMDFKKYSQITITILLVISIIIFVLGLVVWSENVYTGLIYIIVAAIMFLGCIFLYPRIAKIKDMAEVGNRSVQANWLVLSVGIAGMALFLAPFFKLDSMTVPWVAFVLCVIAVLLSAFNIYSAVKKAKARMVV